MTARISASACLIAAACILTGCSNEPGRAADVDPTRARDALKAALDSWKKGEKPNSLRTADPPVVVQDLDWERGAPLMDYRIEGDGKGDTANLRVPVALTLRDARGQESRKNVTYVIGTSPAITVFREILP